MLQEPKYLANMQIYLNENQKCASMGQIFFPSSLDYNNLDDWESSQTLLALIASIN